MDTVARTGSLGHRALRVGRGSVTGQVYLVTTTTLHRRSWFSDWNAARAACAALHGAAPRADITLIAWVLMPDHWHGIVRLDGTTSLSAAINRLKSTSAIAANAAMARHGSLWSRAFHDRAMRADEDVLATARYVVANPVRAGLCRRIGDYPFWDAIWLSDTPTALHP
jgi:REP element-mobilizing transposase RayT